MSDNENQNEFTSITELFKKYLDLNQNYKIIINDYLLKGLVKFSDNKYIKSINIIENYDEVIEEYFENLKDNLNDFSNDKKELIFSNLAKKKKESKILIDELDKELTLLINIRDKLKINKIIINNNLNFNIKDRKVLFEEDERLKNTIGEIVAKFLFKFMNFSEGKINDIINELNKNNSEKKFYQNNLFVNKNNNNELIINNFSRINDITKYWILYINTIINVANKNCDLTSIFNDKKLKEELKILVQYPKIKKKGDQSGKKGKKGKGKKGKKFNKFKKKRGGNPNNNSNNEDENNFIENENENNVLNGTVDNNNYLDKFFKKKFIKENTNSNSSDKYKNINLNDNQKKRIEIEKQLKDTSIDDDNNGINNLYDFYSTIYQNNMKEYFPNYIKKILKGNYDDIDNYEIPNPFNIKDINARFKIRNIVDLNNKEYQELKKKNDNKMKNVNKINKILNNINYKAKFSFFQSLRLLLVEKNFNELKTYLEKYRIILINILILLFIVKKKLLLNFIEYLDENDILKINNLNNNNNGNNNNGNNNNVNNKNYLVNNKNNNVLKNNNLFNSLSNFDKTLYKNNFNGNNKKLFEKYLFLKKKLNQLKNDNYGERNYDKKISIIEDKIKNTIQLLLKK